MPYCAIILKDQDSDDPYVQEQGMTIGLETQEQMKSVVSKMVENKTGQYFVKILNMRVEKINDTDQWAVFPEIPAVGRRIVQQYTLDIE